jgi:leucyl-tRNA synthetase
MTELKNNPEPSTQDAAVQPSEKKKTTPRSDLSAEAQKVLAFLKSCEPYQADATRVIAVFASDEKKPLTISQDDAVYVNRYLNSGADPNLIRSVDDMMAHRRARMNSLLSSTERFCEHGDLQRVMLAVMNLAIDPNVGKISFEKFKKQASNQ